MGYNEDDLSAKDHLLTNMLIIFYIITFKNLLLIVNKRTTFTLASVMWVTMM